MISIYKSSSSYRKARRKDRDNPAALEQEHKLYLEEAVLERKIPETDLRQLVELPPGLGYEEWLASHSKYLALCSLTSCSRQFLVKANCIEPLPSLFKGLYVWVRTVVACACRIIIFFTIRMQDILHAFLL